MSELWYWTLGELAARIRAREISPVEVTRAMLERIERLDPTLHSYATLLPNAALSEAERAESEIVARSNYRGPLHGVPIAVKDLCATKGVRTAAGTRVLADWVPDEDAAVVERLRDAGAILLGKLQMTEGAAGDHHPSITPPVNPWSAGAWAGVSSSGSAVATAAGLCFASLGSDTGGSIRFPSACCGLVGIKPTYGRVPRSGIVRLADSLDHVGPMTRSVEDAAIVLRTIAGADSRDPTSLPQPVPDYTAELGRGIEGVRIGVDEAYATEGVAPEVADGIASAIDVLRGLGAEIREVRMPPTGHLGAACWVPILAVEAARAHADHFPAKADQYGPTVRALIELGHTTSADEYAAAHLERLAFAARFSTLFEDVDLLACPAMPFPPPPAELFGGMNLDKNAPLEIMRFTAPHDISGNPTLTLPCGVTRLGLPLAVQLVGRHHGEPLLCRAGHAYEQATEWHLRHPALS